MNIITQHWPASFSILGLGLVSSLCNLFILGSLYVSSLRGLQAKYNYSALALYCILPAALGSWL